MKKNLKLLVLPALITLTFSIPHKIYGMEDSSYTLDEIASKLSKIQEGIHKTRKEKWKLINIRKERELTDEDKISLAYFYSHEEELNEKQEKWRTRAEQVMKSNEQGMFLLAQTDEAQGNILKAFDQYYKLASIHHCPAQMKLRSIYDDKRGIFENPVQAFNEYQQKANRRDTIASIIVGWMYQDGFGVEKDEKQAFTIFKKAAKQGYIAAQNSLGWMYRKGRGVSQDDEKAVEWFTKAAEQGDTNAQSKLRGWIKRDKVPPPSDANAIKWFTRVAEPGATPTQNNPRRGLYSTNDAEAIGALLKPQGRGMPLRRLSSPLGMMYGE